MIESICVAGMLFANLWGASSTGDSPFGERPSCDEAPDHAEILRALPRVARGVPYVYDEFRDDLEFKVEKLVDRVDPPRYFPLIGPAQLHHCHWKCTVYFTERVQVFQPFPFMLKRRRAEVVYIDKDRLHLVAQQDPGAGEASEPRASCPAGFSRAKVVPKAAVKAEPAAGAPHRVAAPDILLIEAQRLTPKGPYRLEPGEVLAVEMVNTQSRKKLAISPEGTVDLGNPFGTVRVAGLTLDQACRRIQDKMERAVNAPVLVNVRLEKMRGMLNIQGEHLVRPDGTVSLGMYGSVHVEGMTLGQAKAAVEKHLTAFIVDPRISVDLLAYNSRKNYSVSEPPVVQAAPATLTGVQQVQLEIVVAHVNRSALPMLAVPWAENPKGSAGAKVSFGVLKNQEKLLGSLQTLRSSGLAKILAEPRLMTLSGRAGTIASGAEVPVMTSARPGAPSVTYKTVGTEISILPIVKANGKIQLEVRSQITALDSALSTKTAPAFKTRAVCVTVLMEAGQTLAIGGMTLNEEGETVVLVTPRVVDPTPANAAPAFVQVPRTEECPRAFPPLRPANAGGHRPTTIGDVVKMSQKGISTNIILRQIELTNAVFNLTADDIIHLHDQDVSDDIISAMQERRTKTEEKYNRGAVLVNPPVVPGAVPVYPAVPPVPSVEILPAPPAAPRWTPSPY